LLNAGGGGGGTEASSALTDRPLTPQSNCSKSNNTSPVARDIHAQKRSSILLKGNACKLSPESRCIKVVAKMQHIPNMSLRYLVKYFVSELALNGVIENTDQASCTEDILRG